MNIQRLIDTHITTHPVFVHEVQKWFDDGFTQVLILPPSSFNKGIIVMIPDSVANAISDEDYNETIIEFSVWYAKANNIDPELWILP